MFPALLMTLSLLQQASGAPLAPPKRKVAPPRLSIDPPGRVNLGSVGPNELRQQAYVLKNGSDAPIALRILDLSPGVTVEGPALKGPIAPKGSAQLTLRVDPSEFVGWQPRNVKLGTDDPGQGEYFLPIGMTVRPDLTLDSPKKSFGEVALHETPQVAFKFRRETGQATKLWISSALPAYLDAEIDPLPAMPQDPAAPPEKRGSAGTVRLTLRPSKVEPGMRAGFESITVESSAPHQPKFQLYLDWKLKLPVSLSAPRLVFLQPGEWSRNLTLDSRDGKPIRLLSVSIEGAGFEVVKRPSAAAPRLDVTVRRNAKETAKAMLLLHLEGEPAPIRVPVSYLPPEPGKPVATPAKAKTQAEPAGARH